MSKEIFIRIFNSVMLSFTVLFILSVILGISVKNGNSFEQSYWSNLGTSRVYYSRLYNIK